MARPYKPKRNAAMKGAPDYVVDAFDNGGVTADRYTVILWTPDDGALVPCLGMSAAPTHPQGFSQFDALTPVQCAAFQRDNAHQRVKWWALPKRVREHVLDRMAADEAVTP